MLTEKQLHLYADVLLWGLKTARNGQIKKNNIIVIRYDLPAIKLIEILHQKILKMGLHPIHRLLQTPNMEKSERHQYSRTLFQNVAPIQPAPALR